MLQLDNYSRNKRPVADFVARNRRAAKTVKRRSTTRTDGKKDQPSPRPVPNKAPGVQKKTGQPTSRRNEGPASDKKNTGDQNDTVVISRDVLDNLLKMTVMKSSERGGNQGLEAAPGQLRRAGTGTTESGTVTGNRPDVSVSPTSVPGLDLGSSKTSGSACSQHHIPDSSSNISPRKSICVRASSPVKEDYFPFGKPGCGAPLRTASGHVMADLRALAVQKSHQYSGQSSTNIDQHHLSPPPLAETHGPGRRQTTDDNRAGNVQAESSSPRFARGVGPHVDQYMLREKAEKRKRELEHKMFLKEQMEAKLRAKREAKEKAEREEREEEARLARERQRQQEEYRKDLERAARKEEESRRRQLMLQDAIDQAAYEAILAKNANKTSLTPARKRGNQRHIQDTSSHHTVTFDLGNNYVDAEFNAAASKHQLRSSSLLHMSGEDTPPPGHTQSSRQQQHGKADRKSRGSRIPVSSRRLVNKDSSSNQKLHLKRAEKISRKPQSPPVPALAKKLSTVGGVASSSGGVATTRSSWTSDRAEDIPAVRICSPPVPALARKMRQQQSSIASKDVSPEQLDRPLNSTYLMTEQDRTLPSVRITSSPPVPALRNQDRLPAIQQASSSQSHHVSASREEEELHLPSVVSRPGQVAASNQSLQTNRQQVILEQLAQLRSGLLSHCSKIDLKLGSLLNTTSYSLRPA